jgi:hypothetical protein
MSETTKVGSVLFFSNTDDDFYSPIYEVLEVLEPTPSGSLRFKVESRPAYNVGGRIPNRTACDNKPETLLYKEGSFFFLAGGDDETPGPKPTALRKAKMITEKGETWFEDCKSVTHACDENGLPLCGTKVTSAVDKPERWNPWNKWVCPPRGEVSVLIPSYEEPTCKRCAKKAAV